MRTRGKLTFPSGTLRRLWDRLLMRWFRPYRPELYYLRGRPSGHPGVNRGKASARHDGQGKELAGEKPSRS